MDKNQIRETIAKRAAKELKDGDVVNLGIGLPTAVPNYLSPDMDVTFHAENGMLGMGPSPAPGEEQSHLTDAGGQHITAMPYASTFDSAMSFAIVRGGHVDVSILGALQVDEKGDIANWMIPGKKVPGMGGAMDLLHGAKKVILAMEHTAGGKHKIVRECTLPLTAKGQVNRIITEMGVMDITPVGIVLRELNPEFSIEEIRSATGAPLIIEDELKNMEV